MIPASVLEEFNGKRVLVTGGTGMIGRQVVGILLEAGANVMTVSLENPIPGIAHVRGNLRNFGLARSLAADKHFVFHLAGIKASARETLLRPASFFVAMLTTDTTVLEACRLARVGKVLYTSSIGAYAEAEVLTESVGRGRPPMDFIAWAKRMAEFQIRAYGKEYGLDNFAVVRPSAVYGPWDKFHGDAMVVPALMHRIKKGDNPFVLGGDGSPVRDFAFSRDVAEGMVLAAHYGTRGDFVNLGGGAGHSIAEVAETLTRVTGCRHEFDGVKGAGYPQRVMDITRAKEWLGWQPATSLEEGLRKTWEWYSKQE